MKKLLIAVGLVCLLCAFAVQAEKQNKPETALQPMSPIEIAPAVSCSAQGMGAPADAVWIAGECEKREAARFFLAMGQYKSALTIMCNTRAAQEAKACVEH
ncbi:MAG: hypothetical protein WBR26_09100 [Candidatus Acidiferrum sp.]